MGNIENLINKVNETHNHLGELTAICQISIKARKLLMVVSPSGCGKSTAMLLAANAYPDILAPDRISLAELGQYVERLSGKEATILIDDMATTGTEYARNMLMTVLTALVYTHHVESAMAGSVYQITNFNGAALVGIQPVLLRELMMSPVWDASIQDKSLRYYYLYRPESPKDAPALKIHRGLSIDDVNKFEPDKTSIVWQKLFQLGLMQWSKARTRQHLIDYLKAIAALENRNDVIADDYVLLEHLLRPMALEPMSVTKNQLEGERKLNNNLLALLTEYYSYGGKFLLAQAASDYKLPLQKCYEILKEQSEYWEQISKSPSIFKPSKILLATLSKYRLEFDCAKQEKLQE